MTPTDPQPSTSPIPPRPAGLIRRTLRRHRWGILTVWFLGTLAACGAAYLTVKPLYRAYTLIRVEPTVTDLYNVRGGVDDLEPYLQTQVKLITSPNVLTAAGTNPRAAVLARIQNAGDVVQELQKAITVSILPNTYLIEVAMISESGYESSTIVNAVVDAFLEANNEWSDGMTRQKIKNLEQYQGDLRNQTDDLERKWKVLAAKGDLDINSGGLREGAAKNDPKAPRQGAEAIESVNRSSISIEEYRQVRKDLNAVEMELVQAQAYLGTAIETARKVGKVATPAEGRDPVDRQVGRQVNLDPEVSRLMGEIKEAEAKVSDLKRVKPAGDDAEIVAAKRKLDSLVTQFSTVWDLKAQSIRELIEADRVNGRDEMEIRDADMLVKKLLAKQAMLKAKYEKLDVKNRTQGTDSVEIALIQDGRRTLLGMQEAVTKRLEQLKYEAKGEARIRPVNPNGAMVPNRPISDKRMTVLLTAPFLALFGSIVLFLGFEAVVGTSTAKPKSEPIPEV